MSYWIFQANPKRYDIDEALRELSEIRWRVPQYTGQINPGDNVLVWRSGKKAGVVGIGTVRTSPAAQALPDAETRFARSETAERSEATRVVLAVRPVRLISKAQWIDHPALRHHKIITAPMETVFPLTRTEWEAVTELGELPAPPDADSRDRADGSIPAVFSWADRGKDATPLPGGYTGQINSLRYLLGFCRDRRPDTTELESEIHTHFGSSKTNTRFIISYLRRIGFVSDKSGHLEPSQPVLAGLENNETDIVLATMHSRVRFFGEMMEFLRAPHTADDILDYANDSFGMGWSTKAQIQRRRGWMQSAGCIRTTDSKELVLTEVGAQLVERLTLQPPIAQPGAPKPAPEPAPLEVAPGSDTSGGSQVAPNPPDSLLERIRAASILSSNPDAFEEVIAEVFRFLGFQSEKLGGSGKTDVVADAELGLDHRYRVIVDGKTTARGPVTDGQIDWDTLDDHRQLHKADYVVVAGPSFRGDRLFERAESHDVLLLTAGDLIDLVRQHNESPLGVDDYRVLFEGNQGEADLGALSEVVDTNERMLAVVDAVLTAVDEEAGEVGSLSARDLFLLLRKSTDLDATKDEIELAATALASPLFQMLRSEDGQYRPASPRETVLHRLNLLSARLQSE